MKYGPFCRTTAVRFNPTICGCSPQCPSLCRTGEATPPAYFSKGGGPSVLTFLGGGVGEPAPMVMLLNLTLTILSGARK